MNKRKTQAICGAAGMLLLTACHSASLPSALAQQGNAHSIASQANCMLGDKAFAKWITSSEDLASWWQRIYKMQLPQPSLPKLTMKGNALILLYMGQKRSGGYGVTLSNKPVQRQQKVARVHINWKQPQPGMLQTQMLSSPCNLIQLPAKGVEEVHIVDQDNNILFALSRPSSG